MASVSLMTLEGNGNIIPMLDYGRVERKDGQQTCLARVGPSFSTPDDPCCCCIGAGMAGHPGRLLAVPAADFIAKDPCHSSKVPAGSGNVPLSTPKVGLMQTNLGCLRVLSRLACLGKAFTVEQIWPCSPRCPAPNSRCRTNLRIPT